MKGVPEQVIFRSVTVYKKRYPVNAICLLKVQDKIQYVDHLSKTNNICNKYSFDLFWAAT